MNMLSSANYRHIEIDNPICGRRFHLAWEEGTGNVVPKVEVKCPHCDVTIFSASNHPPVILSREENLISSPDGSRPICSECKFQAYKR
jgi:hypothetical protein